MSDLPSAIIFVNNDLAGNLQVTLVRQLFITDSMTGIEFDLRVAEDPSYPQIIHNNNDRILVIRDFSDGYNRALADVAIFIKAGLAAIESVKYGPPSATFPVDRLTIYELLKHYPLSAGIRNIPPGTQDNILVPLNPHRNSAKLYPFGSDPGRQRGGRGALIVVPGDDD